MGTKLTQAVVNRIAEEHQAGSQVYDEDVAGLRIVVGSKSASYKLVGRINDGSDRYVSIMVGRTDAVGRGGRARPENATPKPHRNHTENTPTLHRRLPGEVAGPTRPPVGRPGGEGGVGREGRRVRLHAHRCGWWGWCVRARTLRVAWD